MRDLQLRFGRDVIWACECACMQYHALMLELLFEHLSVSVPAVVWACVESVPAWGAECNAVLTVVWACECACMRC